MIAPGILALVLAAIVLVFGIIILESLGDNTPTYSATVVNESFSKVNETPVRAATAGSCNFGSFSVNQAINVTGFPIPASNYTVQANGTIAFTNGIAAGAFNNSAWNVTYTYNRGTNVCNDANTTLVGLGSFADFWEIIVLALVVSVVIGLLLIVFSSRRVK